jgi:hypothetical protein
MVRSSKFHCKLIVENIRTDCLDCILLSHIIISSHVSNLDGRIQVKAVASFSSCGVELAERSDSEGAIPQRGSRGNAPLGVQGAKSPEKSCIF